MWKEQVKAPSVFRAQMMSCGNKSLVKSGTAVSNMPDSLQNVVSGYKATEKKEVEVCQRHDVLSIHAIILLIKSKDGQVFCIY